MLTAANIQYEIADRAEAVAAGGMGAMHLVTRRLELDKAINRRLGLLKLHLPYHESDHVLNIAYNQLAGGTCLEHLELLRNNEAYLDALGARRIPDPKTGQLVVYVWVAETNYLTISLYDKDGKLINQTSIEAPAALTDCPNICSL